MRNYFRSLTIAGSDSGGGAGIQADLKTFAALRVYGISVVTALTAQNTREVRSIYEVSPAFVADQLDAVLEDIGVDAVKLGMLFDARIMEVVRERLLHHKVEKIILDPVMVAKSGDRLLKEEAVEALRSLLLPIAEVVTPNIPEASILSHVKVESAEAMEIAASELLKLGAGAVLVKGGHSLSEKSSTDCLAMRKGRNVAFDWLEAPRVETRNTHGTGCTLSAAICAYRAQGMPLLESIAQAKEYLTRALSWGAEFQLGKGHGPVFHDWVNW